MDRAPAIPFALFLIHAALVAAAACSSGYTRGSIDPTPAGQLRANDAEIETLLRERPRLPAQFKLGVVFLNSGYGWRFSTADRDQTLAMAESLREERLISAMFVVDPEILALHADLAALAFTERPRLDEIRQMAARYGADAVAVVSGEAQVKEEANARAVFYLTVVGCWLAPGSHRSVLFTARASVWDVRSGVLLASASAEAERSSTRPYALTNEDELTADAKDEAMESLADELQRQLLALAPQS